MDIGDPLGINCSMCGETVEPDVDGVLECDCGQNATDDVLVHRYCLPTTWRVVEAQPVEV